MLQKLRFLLHNPAYGNRRSVCAGKCLQLPSSSAHRMKSVKIKLGGGKQSLADQWQRDLA